MTFYADLLSAMTARLRMKGDNLYYDIKISENERVVAYEEDQGDDGYCETCSYVYDFIRYTVENSAGERRDVEERNVSLSELLRDLEHYDDEMQRND